MKFLFNFLFLSLALSSFAQSHPDPWRSSPNASLEPFFHGVASGDPLTDAVIIWTRVTTDSTSVDVQWRVATDTGMTNIIQSGVVTTDASRDYTVKVDVGGLSPFTFYYYEFTAYNKNSVRGRTRTLPVGSLSSMRFAVVSCANYANGYYNAYDRITERNDIFAVIHLGDYIYEYGDGEFGSARDLDPNNEILSLSDYRIRHSHYKLDEDLMRIHQQYPFFTVWDDHEVANDGWYGGAANHDSATEGDWFQRKGFGIKAYMEWMPIREPDPTNHPQRIYRRFSFGDLLDLNLLDTRYEARDEQNGTGNTATNRYLIGPEQMSWLSNNMINSSARWQILGQQVMMTPLGIAGITFNGDQWDGYPAERQRLYDTVMTHNIRNMVVLTGDIHTSWANDLPLNGYNSQTGANSAGVEFVCTSVTSQNLPFPVPGSIIQFLNNHIKYADLTKHGYMIVDVNQSRTISEWYNVTIDAPNTAQTLGAAWSTLDQSRHLSSASGSTVADPVFIGVQAPLDPRVITTSAGNITPNDNFIWVGLHPNPSSSYVDLQFSSDGNRDVNVQVVDLNGNILMQKFVTTGIGGLLYERLDISKLPAGNYFVKLTCGNETHSKQIVKL